MSSETLHEPAATRKPLNIQTGTDAISGILNRKIEDAVEAKHQEEPEYDIPKAKKIAEESEIIELGQDAEVQESEQETEPELEAKDKPAKDEEEVTSEVEIEPSQIAQLLGLENEDIDVDDAGGLQFHAKINGKPAKVALKDLRHSYELAQTHEERLRELGRERKAFDDEKSQILDNLTNQQIQFTQAVQALEEEYAQDYQSVNWTQLRATDPTGYLTKKQDYDDRKTRISEYLARANYQSEQLKQQYAQNLQQKQAAGAKILEEVFSGQSYKSAPKWDQGEMEKLSKWIMDQGFSAQDISSVAVWQVFKWARDSMIRETELKQAQEAVKKVTKLPKIVKPGKGKEPKEVKRTLVQGLKERQRKSGGDLRATTDLIHGLLSQNER